jgi:hypothetical protein
MPGAHVGAAPADERARRDAADRALYAAKRAGRDRVVRSDELRPRLATRRPAY